MINIGFTYYDEKPVVVKPTTQEILASLTLQQKNQILEGFVRRVKPVVLRRKLFISDKIIIYLYKKIDEIEERSRVLMRGEVLITPAVIDPETGEITTPAVYNTPPTTAAQLLSQVQDDFSDDFTGAQVSTILTKMVNYSKHDGSGDWTYYKNNVIL